jgi:hypothetical protein
MPQSSMPQSSMPPHRPMQPPPSAPPVAEALPEAPCRNPFGKPAQPLPLWPVMAPNRDARTSHR